MGKNKKTKSQNEDKSSPKGIVKLSKNVAKKPNQQNNERKQAKPKTVSSPAPNAAQKPSKPQKQDKKPVLNKGNKPQTQQVKATNAAKPKKFEKKEKSQVSKSPKPKQQGPVPKNDKKKAKPPQKKPPKLDKEDGEEAGAILKIDKRTKTRLKAEIKKEIILKGKSTTVLTNPVVVRRKLLKLENKSEPHSKKVQKKILLLRSLLERLEKEAENPKSTQNNSEAATKKSNPDSIEDSDGEDVAVEKPQYPKFPKNDFVLFIGRINPTITEEMLREHFASSGEVQKVSLPIPKKRKSKRFAYIQMDSEESRQNALKLHDSILNECKINVLYANKGKNKKDNQKQNLELQTKRKANLTEDQSIKIGKKLNANKKKLKKNFSKKV